MTKPELIDCLVEWRQSVKGSLSPENHRRLLETKGKADLERQYAQIRAGEASIPAGAKHPAILDKITDAVLAYRPKPKSKAAKKRKRKAAKREKAQANDSQ